ncbi:putative type I restriction enzymeP M protein [Gimesia panareensis]|uniref:site-specific DNA-methyltransferase (adenine-specific) n=1 Tax=Gimesia panareensis TaxID=2527978 RepID=A0A517QE25_9PLAN|nr:class I SAM-dependent DNA methyltransferase [Gimesia panareensis]QDT29883.1 putative type I restriction enzymeP M protein [Gimesia panareensis]
MSAPKIITREELDRLLWGAADILRGTTDAADFKNHILSLLFLKRLNDVFLERRQEIIDEYVKSGKPEDQATEFAEDPDEYGRGSYYIPLKARWAELMKIPENRAEEIDIALQAVEDENGDIFNGILTSVRFNDERRFGGNAKDLDAFMQRLLTHFANIPLGNHNLIDPDILGESYEYLIDRFADGAGKKGGEYRTPPMVVRTIVELLRPQEGMRIHDPTCGTGGMLIGCGRYVEDHGGNPKNITLTGQEKNYSTWAIAKFNMLLHNFPDGKVELGDTIVSPKFEEGGALQSFDRIIANPPFSLREWHGVEADQDTGKVDSKKVKERWQNDSFRRFHRGIPPTTKGDTAFLQHMIEVCNDRGMVGVVLPHGVLFRGGAEAAVRKALLQEDLFEAVIGLPEKLFYGTGIPASILILNKNKPTEREKHVLFIDASAEGFYHEGKNRNSLRWEDILRIVSVFNAWAKPDRLPEAVEQLSQSWIDGYEQHRNIQLERSPNNELRELVNNRFDNELVKVQEAQKVVKEWFQADHPGGRTSLEKFANVVPLAEIEQENDFNLNISRYVDTSDPPPQLDVKAELKKLRKLEEKRDTAEQQMNQLLAELGYEE